MSPFVPPLVEWLLCRGVPLFAAAADAAPMRELTELERGGGGGGLAVNGGERKRRDNVHQANLRHVVVLVGRGEQGGRGDA